MDVLAFRDLPTGILWWESPARALSVIVKMTLAVGGDEPEPAARSELCFDAMPAFGTPSELDYPSDFVPRKRFVDLILTGHAFAPKPSLIIPAAIALYSGEKRLFEKRFFALAAQPSTAIPLSSSYLRTEQSPASAPVSVRPLSPWSESRARRIGRLPLGIHGGPLVALSPDFDFSVFNAAPPDQCLDPRLMDPALGLSFLLEGLHPQKPAFRFQLPAERPRVYALPASPSSGASGLREIPLACDTLWINTDTSHCTMVFRGTMVLERNQAAPNSLVLTFPPYGLPDPRPELSRNLPKAQRFKVQTLEDLVEAGPGSDRAPPADEEATRAIQIKPAAAETVEEIDDFEEVKTEEDAQAADEIELLPEIEPEIEPEPESEPVPTPRLKDNSTVNIKKPVVLDDETTSAGFIPAAPSPLPFSAAPSALPFRPAPPPPVQINSVELNGPSTKPMPPAPPAVHAATTEPPLPPSQQVPFAMPFARSQRKATVVPSQPGETSALRPVLPFAAAPGGGTQPPPQDPSAPRPSAMNALPFLQGPRLESAPPQTAPAPPQVEAVPEPAPPAPAPVAPPIVRLPPLELGGQSNPIVQTSLPAEPNPVELLLPLERYAALQMDLWQTPGAIEGIFKRHEISELAFRNDEQKRAEALAAEAEQGRSGLALAMAEALAAERAKRAGALLEDALSPEVYAKVRVELEEAGDINQVLQARGISDTVFQAVHRLYRKRSLDDPGFAAHLRGLIEQARTDTKKPPQKTAPKKRRAAAQRKQRGAQK